jgi:hypothetical protein
VRCFRRPGSFDPKEIEDDDEDEDDWGGESTPKVSLDGYGPKGPDNLAQGLPWVEWR